MDRVAIFGARILEYGGYIVLFVSMFILCVYAAAMFNCILSTPVPGFEWGCASDATVETLQGFLRSLPWSDSENPALPSVL
jgi:hypothetical protein